VYSYLLFTHPPWSVSALTKCAERNVTVLILQRIACAVDVTDLLMQKHATNSAIIVLSVLCALYECRHARVYYNTRFMLFTRDSFHLPYTSVSSL